VSQRFLEAMRSVAKIQISCITLACFIVWGRDELSHVRALNPVARDTTVSGHRVVQTPEQCFFGACLAQYAHIVCSATLCCILTRLTASRAIHGFRRGFCVSISIVILWHE
jgi:hypothetical protein